MKLWSLVIAAGIFMSCTNPTMNDQNGDSSNTNLRQSRLHQNKTGFSDDSTEREHDRNHKNWGCRWKKIDSKAFRMVAGCWSVSQSNGYTGLLSLIQKDSVLTGQMDWDNFPDSPVKGNISGDSVSYALAYPDLAPLVGYYYAKLDASGTKLLGTANSNNGYSVTWNATKTTCPITP